MLKHFYDTGDTVKIYILFLNSIPYIYSTSYSKNNTNDVESVIVLLIKGLSYRQHKLSLEVSFF